MVEQVKELDPDGLAAIAHAVAFEGYTFKDFARITDEQMEQAYAVAFHLVNSSQFREAEALLAWLAGMDQFDPRYLIGLGICRQQRGNFQGAITAYAAGSILDVENPIPPLRAAECYLALGRLGDAQSGIKAALHWAGDSPDHGAIRERATVLQAAIDRRQGRKGQ